MARTPKWVKNMDPKEEITIRRSGYIGEVERVEITVARWHFNERNKIHEGAHVELSNTIDLNEIIEVLRVRCEEKLANVQ